jgi:hypothetical protein
VKKFFSFARLNERKKKCSTPGSEAFPFVGDVRKKERERVLLFVFDTSNDDEILFCSLPIEH